MDLAYFEAQGNYHPVITGTHNPVMTGFVDLGAHIGVSVRKFGDNSPEPRVDKVEALI